MKSQTEKVVREKEEILASILRKQERLHAIFQMFSSGKFVPDNDLSFLYEECENENTYARKIICLQGKGRENIARLRSLPIHKVSTNYEEAISPGIEFHFGDLVIPDAEKIPSSLPKYISGNLIFPEVKVLQKLEIHSHVRKKIIFSGLLAAGDVQILGSASDIEMNSLLIARSMTVSLSISKIRLPLLVQLDKGDISQYENIHAPKYNKEKASLGIPPLEEILANPEKYYRRLSLKAYTLRP